MSTDWQAIPPGRIWLPVDDLPSALLALSVLTDHILSFDYPDSIDDSDEL